MAYMCNQHHPTASSTVYPYPHEYDVAGINLTLSLVEVIDPGLFLGGLDKKDEMHLSSWEISMVTAQNSLSECMPQLFRAVLMEISYVEAIFIRHDLPHFSVHRPTRPV